MNFNNYGNETPGSGGGAGGASGGSGKPPNIFPLARQSSVYSLTFDEFQSTMGGSIGKDFGSMNMDELLKNIWTAEETQQTAGTTNGVSSVVQEGSSTPSNYLQRQGSITLPRTLSQKTVDEVWKNLSGAGMKLPVRQQTLGEVTLEEFLFRAGVVREETKPPEKAQNFDLLGDLTRPVSDQALGFGFQQMSQNTGVMSNRILENNIQPGLVSNRALESNNQSALQPANGVRQQQPLQIFPKQPILPYANPIPISSTQIGSPGIRGGIMGITDPMLNGNLGHNGGIGMLGTGSNGVTVAMGSPTLSSNGIGRTNGDTSSVSPIPYVFTGGLRGRRSNNAVEKVIERRQRRMIKNRESAARSRARKQAYTTELEAEVAKLKEENQELQKKEVEIIEMQKNQVFEMINMQQGGKRQRLKRTQTGPW